MQVKNLLVVLGSPNAGIPNMPDLNEANSVSRSTTGG